MKRVTRHASSGMNATTSGPMPTVCAASAAACSACRSMPSSSVSLPARRAMNRSPSTTTRKLWLVIPPGRGEVRTLRARDQAGIASRARSSRGSGGATAAMSRCRLGPALVRGQGGCPFPDLQVAAVLAV